MRVRAIPGCAFGYCAKFGPNLFSVRVPRLELALDFEPSSFEIVGEAFEQSDDRGWMREYRFRSACNAAKIFRFGPEVGHLLGTYPVLGLVYVPPPKRHFHNASGIALAYESAHARISKIEPGQPAS